MTLSMATEKQDRRDESVRRFSMCAKMRVSRGQGVGAQVRIGVGGSSGWVGAKWVCFSWSMMHSSQVDKHCCAC